MNFWKIFERVEPTGFCWLWTGGLNNCGYGQLGYHSTTVVAHRLIYELLVGPIPPGMQLDHLCHVRQCVNPDHLEPVTKSENMRRAGKRNGWVEGGKPREIKPRKPRMNILTREECKYGHVLSDVGVYQHVTPTGQQVRGCRECRRRVACTSGHRARGCPNTCILQTHPRTLDMPNP